MKSNFLNYDEVEGKCDQRKESILPKEKKDKDIYSDYQDSTLGIRESDNTSVIVFKQFTNPTKSKYDNVVGWITSDK